MRKIPTALVRNPEDRAHVLPEVTPGCEWVLAGEGIPTRKYDGTCMLLHRGGWLARREVKPGKEPPPNWVEQELDAVTGKRVGWEPVAQSPFAKFHNEALIAETRDPLVPGTYELVGPKINGNPEHSEHHRLIRHADAEVYGGTGERSPQGLMELVQKMRSHGWEGVVWHHLDGRMAKLKAKDVPARVPE